MPRRFVKYGEHLANGRSLCGRRITSTGVIVRNPYRR
jgi:hypothetical protein